MKGKRKIRWGMPVGVKQFHTTRFGTERSLPGEFSLFLLCTVFNFGAACGMLRSMFEWKLLTGEMLFRIVFVTLLVGGLTEVAALIRSRFALFVQLGIPVLGTAGVLFYLLRTEQGERMLSGFQAVAHAYIGEWNSYYKTSFSMPAGEVFLLEEAVGFAFAALCMWTVWYGRIRKKAYVTTIIPFLVLVAGFLVGKVPSGLSLFAAAATVFFAGAAAFAKPEFLATPDKNGRAAGGLKQVLWVPVAVGLLVLCLVVKTAGGDSAEERVYNGKKAVLDKQNELIKKVTEWSGWQEFDVGKTVEKLVDSFLKKRDIETENQPEANFARLDNEKPEYDEVTVLKVALEKYPKYGSYLVGFYADVYDDGVWDTDVKAFRKVCEKAGFSPEMVSDGLITLAADRVAQYYGGDSLETLSSRTNNGWLYYAKANRIKAYLPYFAKTSAEGIRTEGDSRYIKEKAVTKLPFVLWNYDVEELVKIMFRGGETDKSWEKEPWELWYESYVTEAYLDVPKGMEQVKKVAEEIRTYKRDYFSIEGKASVNFDRINKAHQVADWMRNNTSYSLELPELPKGSDPVEFFLGTSRQGYCMHYASASALILRELGVPARYVSGYVAGSYKKNDVSGMHEATVLDSNAHAWVEIYLEGIGWIPVEVTKGYSVSPAGEWTYKQTENGSYRVVKENWPKEDGSPQHTFSWSTMQPFMTPAPTATPAPTETPSVTDDETTPPEDTEGGESISQTGGAEEPEHPGEQPEVSQTPGDDLKEDENKLDLRVNPVILLFALPIIGLILGIIVPVARVYRKTRSSLDEKAIRKKFGRFGNRQKIKLMNRRLYRKLRGKGKISRRFLRDAEYEEVLRGYSGVLRTEERERYMHLVKGATFSYNEFTDEEVDFCKQVYHKVLYEKPKAEDDRE